MLCVWQLLGPTLPVEALSGLPHLEPPGGKSLFYVYKIQNIPSLFSSRTLWGFLLGFIMGFFSLFVA